MKIIELVLKNFGKFSDRRIMFSEGINLICGKNEAGKTTIHTFLKSMLFGMERSRGRGAANDMFSKYEPWENPNYYAGTLRFVCGTRSFCLDRHFDKYAKSVVLFCAQDDRGWCWSALRRTKRGAHMTLTLCPSFPMKPI